MVNFQIVSDLHIEYKNNEIPDPLLYITPSSDILILAGDIGSLYKFKQLYGFLFKLSSYFKFLIYVPGNHEYYKEKNKKHKPMFILNKNLKAIERIIPNLIVLNKKSIIINDLYIVGCTLWSNLQTKLPRFIVKIKDIDKYTYNKLYYNHLSYIIDGINYAKRNKLKLLVITHHCPTQLVLSNKKNNYKYKSLYVSDLDYLLSKDLVNTWICGHTHSNFDIQTPAGTRVVSNQYGKPKDNIKNFIKNFTINI